MAEPIPLHDRDASYLDQIERGALDPNTSIADVLRLCVALGGRAKSQDLRAWALKELNGYELDDELPPYRIISASLYMDNTNRAGLNRIPQQIAPAMLPKEVRADIGEEMRLRQKIAILEAEARKAQEQNEHLIYTFSQSAMVANLMTTRGWESGRIPLRQMVSAIYWRVSPAELFGVVDHVRTVLTQLVAEIAATMPTGQKLPSAVQADRAVNIVVNGGDGHQFVLPDTSGGGSSTTTVNGASTSPAPGHQKRGWIWTTLGFVVTLVGTIAGLGQWLRWKWPWLGG